MRWSAKFSKSPQKLLWLAAALTTALTVLTLPGLFLDSRLVTGVNPWIKPLKFDVSVAIFSITLAWVVDSLPAAVARRVSFRLTAMGLFEIFCIYLQAARGEASHFNLQTPFNAAIFSLMGIAIAYLTVVVIQIFIEFVKRPPALPKIQLRAIQLGLASVIVGCFLGGYMSSQKGHTIGAADGGPGLPLTHWSTQAGDLRVTHFLGLHGIQLILLVAWLLQKKWPRMNDKVGTRWITAVFAVWLFLDLFTFWQALEARPFLS